MLINKKNYRTIWLTDDEKIVEIIDQRFLPFQFVIESLHTVQELAIAIKDMHLRGAPLIGAAGAYGMYLAALQAEGEKDYNAFIKQSAVLLEKTRPTAVNLKWAIDQQLNVIFSASSIKEKIKNALITARQIADEDVGVCRNIGKHGVKLIEEISRKKQGEPVQILTHCNAGALAAVDIGPATATIYQAHNDRIPIHVWVDETRPRNQGKLTNWELQQANVPNTVICDNTGGHLMQSKMVDIVIVGTDRTTAYGDVANKIGTYLKALAAYDNHIPFYVALPSSTIDWNLTEGTGLGSIPIEERDSEEVLFIEGYSRNTIEKVQLFPDNTDVRNYGFDITPARLVTGFITEKGICQPNELRQLFGH